MVRSREQDRLFRPHVFLPLRLAVILGLSIFAIELGIMWLLPTQETGRYLDMLDASVLTLTVTPILYVTLFRPLKTEIAERRLAQAEILQAHGELELKVKDRTSALTASLARLEEEVAQRRMAEAQLLDENSQRRAVEESLKRRVAELDALQHLEHVLADREDLSQALDQAAPHIARLLDAQSARIRWGAANGAGECGPGTMDIPLMVKDECVARLLVERRRGESAFLAEDLRLGHTVADRLAAAVESERLREMQKQRAAAEERERLARDLHDAVTQNIYSASLIAEALPALYERSPQQGLHNLERLRLLVRGALAEMRTLLFELRPSSLEAAELATLLERLADALAGQLQIPVEQEAPDDLELPVDVKIGLYRLAQEAFSNVAKHAEATRVSAVLTEEDDTVRLEVRDDGRGFDPDAVSSEHMGLRIMRERMKAIGASLRIESAIGKGTSIVANWPERGDGGKTVPRRSV